MVGGGGGWVLVLVVGVVSKLTLVNRLKLKSRLPNMCNTSKFNQFDNMI